MARLTKGTQLYFLDPETDTVTKVVCPTGITGLGGSRDQIPTTCLDSEEAESMPGNAQPSTVNVPIQFDQTEPSHVRLFELFQASDQQNLWWAIGLSDGIGVAPTSGDSSGWTLPSTRTFFTFEGYIADFPVDFALNSVQQGTMTIQRSGPAELSVKA